MTIAPGTYLHDVVTLDDNVRIGERAVLDFAAGCERNVTVGDDVYIGWVSTVFEGVQIGRSALVYHMIWLRSGLNVPENHIVARGPDSFDFLGLMNNCSNEEEIIRLANSSADEYVVY